MTAQFTETLRYRGVDVAICTEPLGDYFLLGGFMPSFDCNCSALWRGYVGHWEIVEDRLYLIGLAGSLADGTDVILATVFPDFPDRVFAHWYSGTIRLPQGKQLEYVHAGFGSIYQWDLFLDIDRGVVVATRLRQNGPSASAGDNEDGDTNQSTGELRTGESNRGTS